MMPLVLWNSPFLEPFGWALIHFLWQGTLAAGTLALMLFLKPTVTPATRYRWGCLCLLVMAASPFLSFSLFINGEIRPANQSSEGIVNQDEGGFTPNGVDLSPWNAPSPPFNQGATGEGTDWENPQTQPTLPAVFPLNDSFSPSVSRPFLPWVVFFWAMGVMILSLRLCGSWLLIQGMKTRCTRQIPIEWSESFGKLARRLRVSQPVRILESALVEVPTLIGWIRPVILLPVGFLTGMTPRQIEAILAHEFAHILRRDYLVNLLQTVVETVLFYHPATWWVSSFVRAERENCCDDIAAKVCGETWEYARALAALEGFRAPENRFALAANGGSLLHRIQRLAGLPIQRTDRPTLWVVLAVVLLLLPLLGTLGKGNAALSHSETTNETISEEPVVEWGQPAKGLQCRIVPLSPTIDDETTELQKPVRTFANGKDLTLGVELKNVSDQPVQLVGVRYGDSYGASSGKWNAGFFAPFLFDFEFMDASGKNVPRANRSYIGSMVALSGASVHEIAPGKSLVMALRPGQFSAPMDQILPPGSFQVRLRYLGLDQETLTEIKKHWAAKPIARAWSGPVTSNTVPFEIQPPKMAATREEIQWGPETRGLRAAMQFRLRNANGTKGDFLSTIPMNSVVEPVFLVKNVSKDPISLVSETWRQDDRVFVKPPDEKETELNKTWYSGWPVLVRWTLKPEEIATLDSSSMGFVENAEAEKKMEHPIGKNLVVKTGKHHIRVSLNIGSIQTRDADGKNAIPGKGDWTGILETGSTPLTIRERVFSDSAQAFEQLSLDQWSIARIEGKSIGIASSKQNEGRTPGTVQITVMGQGSIVMTPMMKTAPLKPEEAKPDSGKTVFKVAFTEEMNWKKGGIFQFKGNVNLDYQPGTPSEGETMQLQCDTLEIHSGNQDDPPSATLLLKAEGNVKFIDNQTRFQGQRAIMDPNRKTIRMENGQMLRADGTGTPFGNWKKGQEPALPQQKPGLNGNSQPGKPQELLNWLWKGPFNGHVIFVDPQGKPITKGVFTAQHPGNRQPSAQGSIQGIPVNIPECDGRPLSITVRAPGFEERTFSNIVLKYPEVRQIELAPAVPARFQLVSSVDGQPVAGAKVRFFNKNSDKAGGGPFPMNGIQGPVWTTSADNGSVLLDSFQKVDPSYPDLGSAVYFFYVEPPPEPRGPTPWVGRFVGPIRSGDDLGKIQIGPGLEVSGEIRGTKEELDLFDGEWDQPFELKTANPQAKFAYAVSQKLETTREGDRVFFHLTGLRPGKLRIVANFSPRPHSVSHSYGKRDAKGTDLEMFTEIKSPLTTLVVVSPKGLIIEK